MLPRVDEELLDDQLAAEGPNPEDEIAAYEWANTELGRAWIDECKRRSADLDAGRTTAIPYEDARARISARLRELRERG